MVWQRAQILYQRLLKYQISFPLFKVSEPWKFQMPGLCISIVEPHTSEKGIFLSFQTEWELCKLVILDTTAYEGLLKYQISFPLFKVSEP